jgi:UDP-N-acetylmuramate dehydrogenase
MTEAYTLHRDVPLETLNTFGVRARATLLATVRDTLALLELMADPALAGVPAMVLGQGSNLLLVGDYPGVMLRLAASDCRVLEDDGTRALVRVDAGAVWDTLVDWTLANGLGGLENLALIPGLTGAAPIQNIGAYGVEVREHIETVEAWDRRAGRLQRISAADCAFGYRDSLFKSELDRWIVTAVEFRLSRSAPLQLEYAGVREELEAVGCDRPDARTVALAVRRLRRRKLPDPAVVGNAGSFFKNPVVTSEQAETLRARHPSLPIYPAPGAGLCKLSAAWLIEACGWRGHREGDAGISQQHALVVVNHGTATGAELLAVARRVAKSVNERFGVELEPEPRIVGAAW